MLSVERSQIPQTARRLAQKQPSFKESVTAHWSNLEFGAENEPRLKRFAEDTGFVCSTKVIQFDSFPVCQFKSTVQLVNWNT